MPIAKIAQLSDGDREKWQAGHKLRRAEKREQAPALQKLELVTEEEAGFRKRIKTWFTMMRNAGAQMMGYRVMIGAELNQAKELLPHGEFTKWVESEFGLPERTQRDWREFSALFLAEVDKKGGLPTVGKTATVAVLGKHSKKAADLILGILPKVMEARGMVDFCREIKLLREPTPAGGYRPSPEDVEAFLAEKHPELGDGKDGKHVTYEELPEKIQREFRKWLAGRPEPASDIAERANEQGKLHKVAMIAAVTGKWAMAMSQELREDHLILAEKWVEKLKELGKGKLKR
jgi:hypothetical protein